MKKLLFLCAVFFVVISCEDKYETEIKYAVKHPRSQNISFKTDLNKIDAVDDYDAKVKYVEAVIVQSNIMPGSIAFISGKLKKNGEYLSTNLSLKTLDSINLASENLHRSLNKKSRFISYEQMSDSIAAVK
jgi:hypothetical protein